MSVAREVTTYTLDYANKGQILLEQGGAFAQTKHYLYGLSCIGELVDAGDPETEEWRYYQRDGNNLVRQTTNSAAKITLAWAYSPEGAVLIGEKGPVTNLGCGDIYDWSTGLVYKNGRYFDPNLGIWLVALALVCWQSWIPLQKRRYCRYFYRKPYLGVWLSVSFTALILTACDRPLPSCNPDPELRTPAPIDPSYDAAIRESTILIQYGKYVSETDFSIHNSSLGTVTDDGSIIITHNHFPDTSAAEEVLIRAHDYSLIGAYSKSLIEEGMTPINEQTLQIRLPAQLAGVRSAKRGNSKELVIGDNISVAYRIPGDRTVSVYHSNIIDIGIPVDENGVKFPNAVGAAFIDNSSGVLKEGDSGGGWFFRGELVANSWSIAGPRGRAIGALLSYCY